MKEIGIILILFSFISILVKRENLIIVLISLELLLLGISLILISSSLIFDDMAGIMTAIFILTIGAAESAIGLSILTKTY